MVMTESVKVFNRYTGRVCKHHICDNSAEVTESTVISIGADELRLGKYIRDVRGLVQGVLVQLNFVGFSIQPDKPSPFSWERGGRLTQAGMRSQGKGRLGSGRD